jgi:hypothetical protein
MENKNADFESSESSDEDDEDFPEIPVYGDSRGYVYRVVPVEEIRTVYEAHRTMNETYAMVIQYHVICIFLYVDLYLIHSLSFHACQTQDTLAVTGYSQSLSERTLRNYFASYGGIKRINRGSKVTVITYHSAKHCNAAKEKAVHVIRNQNLRVGHYSPYTNSKMYRVSPMIKARVIETLSEEAQARTLFISGLPWPFDKKTVPELFNGQSIGSIESVNSAPYSAGTVFGLAAVTFKDPLDGDRVEALRDLQWNGLKIDVSKVYPGLKDLINFEPSSKIIAREKAAETFTRKLGRLSVEETKTPAVLLDKFEADFHRSDKYLNIVDHFVDKHRAAFTDVNLRKQL